MIWLVLSMVVAVALAALVVGVVALPARRSGRRMLTDRGERMFRVAEERARAVPGAAARVADRGGSSKGARRSS